MSKLNIQELTIEYVKTLEEIRKLYADLYLKILEDEEIPTSVIQKYFKDNDKIVDKNEELKFFTTEIRREKNKLIE